MVDVLVVIPWRPGCPHREAALRWVLGSWAALGFSVRLGVHDDGRWCKAEAVAAALRGSGAGVLVVADADCWSEGASTAVELVRAGAPWAMPHYLVHRLSPQSTLVVLDGEQPHDAMPLDDTLRCAYKGTNAGGIVVLRRDVWDDCPLDPRFRGWGHEDDSWGRALTILHGKPARPPAPLPRLYHLWHPPQERVTWGLGSMESHDLGRRYIHAWKRRDAAAMRDLIREAR